MALIQAWRPVARCFLRSGLPHKGVAAACPWSPPHSASSWVWWWWLWKWWRSAPGTPPPQQEEDEEQGNWSSCAAAAAASRSMSLSWRLRWGPGLVDEEEDEQQVVVDAVAAAAMEWKPERERLCARGLA